MILAQLRHVLSHFRGLAWYLTCAAVALVVMALDGHPGSGTYEFAWGMGVVAAGLAVASVGFGLVGIYRCGKLQAVTVTRQVDMSDAGPPLVQRLGETYRITWIAPDNESHVALTMAEGDARALAGRLHEELYRG